MTSNKEDYLKAIYEEGGLEAFVSNKRLAHRLGVAAASVSEMLGKLRREGLIDYQPYHGSRLTPAGRARCAQVVRSHQLWEVFLTTHLGYTWREAHEDAHLLEHAAPTRMVERLDAFLGVPATCPHGSPILRGEEGGGTDALVKLTQLTPGECGTVRRLQEEGPLLDYLAQRGLQVGEPLQVTAVEPMEGPFTCRQAGRTFSLSCKAADGVWVERQP